MHDFVHIELPAVNLDREASFYSKLFGWNFQPMRPGEYLLFSKPDGDLLGGLSRVENMPDNSDFQNYVAVDDMAAVLLAAQSLGADVHQERRDLGNGMGFIAVIKSPDGFFLGLWSEK